MKRTLFVVATSALLIAPAFALAQDPPPQQPPAQDRPAAQAAPASSAEGELVKVDADAKTLSIKSADGKEMQFTYTEATEVSGARGGVAGLATKAGSKVTVQFTEAGGAKTATKIEVAS
jgi:Cu/Ag efflux protein CusF